MAGHRRGQIAVYRDARDQASAESIPRSDAIVVNLVFGFGGGVDGDNGRDRQASKLTWQVNMNV